MGTQGKLREATAGGTSSSETVEIRNLRKTFSGGDIVACEDIDLTIDSDEFVVLLGPSGCGKTTTLRCISGLETADRGQILIDGEDVTGTKPKDRDLAFVFQSIALFPHMSVRKNIRFGLDMKTDLSDEEKRQRVENVAETLGIHEMLDRKPAALSGGQQQRVSLGRAMVMEPEAFLLDEPFSALDANLRDQMRVEIKKLQRQLQRAMVFVTHDQEEAMTLGDTIVIMDDGHIQQVGSPYDIYNEPQNQFVAGFIGSPSANMLECELATRDGTCVVRNDRFELELTDRQTEQLSSYDGRSVVLGIRPEYVDISADDPLFAADITVVEPLGSDDAIYLDAGGTELRSIAPQGAVSPDDDATVAFDPENVWLFDEEGGRLL